jgi:hypothetical protein
MTGLPWDLSDMRGQFGPYALLLLIWVLLQRFGMTLNLLSGKGLREPALTVKW